jgi:hypothetical protein
MPRRVAIGFTGSKPICYIETHTKNAYLQLSIFENGGQVASLEKFSPETAP